VGTPPASRPPVTTKPLSGELTALARSMTGQSGAQAVVRRARPQPDHRRSETIDPTKRVPTAEAPTRRIGPEPEPTPRALSASTADRSHRPTRTARTPSRMRPRPTPVTAS
jgi:hypothetical protein